MRVLIGKSAVGFTSCYSTNFSPSLHQGTHADPKLEEVEKLAGLHNHFDRVHAHRPLLTELTVRNYCGNSFHPEHIQAAIGHPERLRSWLAEPVDPSTKPSWTGVIHPKQARTQYHALREQVQTLDANTTCPRSRK